MAIKKTTFAESRTDRCETKKYNWTQGDSTVGRTEMYIDCPFCGSTFLAYLWSLCGGGKRCDNAECGAIFGGYGAAYRLKDEFRVSTRSD